MPRGYRRRDNTAGAAHRARMPLKGPSLADARPDVAAQWHPNLNGGLTPSDVTPGAKTAVWWHHPETDEHGNPTGRTHEWGPQAVRTRTSLGIGCTVCSGRQAQPGINDLASQAPDIARDYLPELNGGVPADRIPVGSRKDVTWKCADPAHPAWTARVQARTKQGNGCRYCAGQAAVPGVNDLVTVRPDVAALLHPTLNGDLDPTTLMEFSNTVVWFQCAEASCRYEWPTAVSRVSTGDRCGVCANRVVVVGRNDLLTTHPAIAQEWVASAKEGASPQTVTAGAGVRVTWQCSEGHRWTCSLYTRTAVYSTGCPDCQASAAEKRLIAAARDAWGHAEQGTPLPVPWRKQKIARVDGLVHMAHGHDLVLEYDGSYFHRGEKKTSLDIEKTLALLEAGYLVVRVREGELPPLPLQHERLLQVQQGLKEPSAAVIARVQEWLAAA